MKKNSRWSTGSLLCYNGGTMIPPDYRQALESQHRVLVILWWFFFSAIFLYAWIAKAFFGQSEPAEPDAFAQVSRAVLWLLAFLDLATLGWWIKSFLTKQAILGRVKRYKILQSLQGHKTPIEERAAEVVSSYVTSKIVAFALAEAIAVYGFAFAFTSGYFLGQYVLSAASGLLLFLEFPSKRLLGELVKDVEAGAPPS